MNELIKKTKYRMNIISRLLKLTLQSIFTVFMGFLLLWSFTFQFTVTYIIILTYIIVLLKFKNYALRFRTLIVLGLVYILFLPLTLHQYQIKTSNFFKQIQDGKDLNTTDKAAVYGLNIMIGILAFPIYPEISKETLLMLIPDDDGSKYFESNFFLKSRRIQEGLKLGNKRVTWPISDYVMGKKEARFALALNPCTLTVKKTKNNIYYSASVPVKYPIKSEVILLKYPITVSIQEGLFAYLQKEGWLHTYTAIWYCNK